MNTIEIGKFIAELRKEKGFTQDSLGEKLGVTNKTVSRWETGMYIPPADILLSLSELFEVSINEILSGRRLTEEEYREKAELNLKETVGNSAFNLKEKTEFYRRKWRKEHISTLLICTVSWIVLLVSLKLQGVENYLLGTVGGILALLYYAVLNNRMMSYVEDHIYGGRWNEYKGKE
ncbi:MAG: helix-turn-helix domain-containing protein [Clostridia bacterium]|nr:helix-turn-helix domain-containing protein [Clostridia bacterium]